jgi:hypothetical protein
MTPPSDSADQPPTPNGDGRQPYEPPSIECEDLFEVLALSCGKINPTTRSCFQVPRTS